LKLRQKASANSWRDTQRGNISTLWEQHFQRLSFLRLIRWILTLHINLQKVARIPWHKPCIGPNFQEGKQSPLPIYSILPEPVTCRQIRKSAKFPMVSTQTFPTGGKHVWASHFHSPQPRGVFRDLLLDFSLSSSLLLSVPDRPLAYESNTPENSRQRPRNGDHNTGSNTTGSNRRKGSTTQKKSRTRRTSNIN